MKNIASFEKIIEEPKKIVIVMHQHPDGDAVSSSLAMAIWLESKGHQIVVISPNKYPFFLKWLPSIDKITVWEEFKNQEKIEKQIKEADVILCLDFSPFHRAGDVAPMIRESQAIKIAIDHHPDEGEKLDLLICDTTAAATCAIIYDLMVALGEEKKLDQTIATLLYVGIITDTGCFSNSNTTSSVHHIAGHLLEKGIAANEVYMAIYGQQSLSKLFFIAHAVTHRLTVLHAHKTAYFAIPSKDFKRFHMRPGDKAGIVNYALTLQGVSVAALIVEQKKDSGSYTTLSLRSVGDIEVNKLAHKYFNGGGHKNAAGAISSSSLSDVVKQFEKMVKKEL